MKPHKIGWLNVPGYIPQTWNPIVGCSKVSEGCRNCYAEKMAKRLAAMMDFNYMTATGGGGNWNGETILCEPTLQKPLGWKKPRAIFVNSMGDLFHENTPDEWVQHVFRTMSLCPQHLFIVLTKRAERMEKFVTARLSRFNEAGMFGELPNVWLGVTAENQAAADERIPYLLRTPAAVRFVSVEPMIGPVTFTCEHLCRDSCCGNPRLDWVICGGESGPQARPMNPYWARSLRDQCSGACVPFFFKQIFEGRKKADLLDGRQWHQWPGGEKAGADGLDIADGSRKEMKK